ncbi:MAG: alpha/beta fold hydrolase [Mycobacterium sp.]
MAELTLRHATIEYHEFGPRDSVYPPVLFVHGILVDGRLWGRVVEDLARRGFRCIVPTLPLGSHRIPVRDVTALSLSGVAEMIHDALVTLDLSDVTLVGSDTGGGLCQLVVDAHPDRIGRLVLTNCDAFDQCPRTTDLTDVAPRLPRFTKPVTLVWGQRDRCFTPGLGRRLAALFSNAKLIEVPDAKTFVALDEPDAVIDAIAAITA